VVLSTVVRDVVFNNGYGGDDDDNNNNNNNIISAHGLKC
jgi:hypothetical protein